MYALVPTVDDRGTEAWQVDPATRQASHHQSHIRRFVLLLCVLPPLLAFVALGVWLVWVVANNILGSQGADLAVIGLLASTFAISRAVARRGGSPLCGGKKHAMQTPNHATSPARSRAETQASGEPGDPGRFGNIDALLRVFPSA